jgi:hypothetical protein
VLQSKDGSRTAQLKAFLERYGVKEATAMALLLATYPAPLGSSGAGGANTGEAVAPFDAKLIEYRASPARFVTLQHRATHRRKKSS